MHFRFNHKTGNWEYLAHQGPEWIAPVEVWFFMDRQTQREFDRTTLLRPAAPALPTNRNRNLLRSA